VDGNRVRSRKNLKSRLKAILRPGNAIVRFIWRLVFAVGAQSRPPRPAPAAPFTKPPGDSSIGRKVLKRKEFLQKSEARREAFRDLSATFR
jgi:hypothetical protein